MKFYTIKRGVIGLRLGITILLLSFFSLFFFSFTVSSRLADDIWNQLGISEQQGLGKIKTSFLNNYLDYYGIRNVKNIAAGNRTAIAGSLLSFTKQYVSSSAFKSEYEKIRMQSRPIEPTGTVKSKEDIRKEKITESEKAIKDIEESMKTMNADMKKIMQEGLDMQNNMLKEYKDPDSQMIELFYQGELMNHESEMNRYKQNLKEWEANYPADYKEMIKARLQKYLSIANTVDFNAGLTDKNGKKYFINQDYERKSTDWKMIYRAGKDVYEITKGFAEKWLKEL